MQCKDFLQKRERLSSKIRQQRREEILAAQRQNIENSFCVSSNVLGRDSLQNNSPLTRKSNSYFEDAMSDQLEELMFWAKQLLEGEPNHAVLIKIKEFLHFYYERGEIQIPIGVLIQEGVFQTFVNFLSFQSYPELRMEVVQIFGYIALSEAFSPYLIYPLCIPLELLSLLTISNVDICLQIIMIIGNVGYSSKSIHQELMKWNILERMLELTGKSQETRIIEANIWVIELYAKQIQFYKTPDNNRKKFSLAILYLCTNEIYGIMKNRDEYWKALIYLSEKMPELANQYVMNSEMDIYLLAQLPFVKQQHLPYILKLFNIITLEDSQSPDLLLFHGCLSPLLSIILNGASHGILLELFTLLANLATSNTPKIILRHPICGKLLEFRRNWRGLELNGMNADLIIQLCWFWSNLFFRLKEQEKSTEEILWVLEEIKSITYGECGNIVATKAKQAETQIKNYLNYKQK